MWYTFSDCWMTYYYWYIQNVLLWLIFRIWILILILCIGSCLLVLLLKTMMSSISLIFRLEMLSKSDVMPIEKGFGKWYYANGKWFWVPWCIWIGCVSKGHIYIILLHICICKASHIIFFIDSMSGLLSMRNIKLERGVDQFESLMV